MSRRCAISIDLDPLWCYFRIHGLGEPPAALADVVLRRALPRFLSIMQRRGISATLFVVGSDLERPEARDALAAAARDGHELANHSWAHDYGLAKLGRHEIDADVRRAHAAIAAVAGREPVGFRSPGYDQSELLWSVLGDVGYRYDSSVFPSWPYYLAKLGVMAAMRLVGRRSRAVLVDPRTLFTPAEPYRPGRTPFSRGQSTMVEIPVSTTPALRVPAIGTWIVGSPTAVRARILEAMRRRPFFNLEMHGMDFVGAEEDGIPSSLVARQPDLRVPLTDKLRAFEASLDRLHPEYRFSTLAEVASDLQRDGSL